MGQAIRFQATVEELIRHTHDVATYRLHSARRLPRFVPGQFIHLTVDNFDPSGFWPESRVFSVANGVVDRRTIELTISRQGAYTSRILDSLNPGDEVWCKGPYGEFTIGAGQGYRRAILIAGGTGITPFCAFMDGALAVGKLPIEQATLHYAARTPDLLIYRELAERCAYEVPGFEARYYVEDAAAAVDANLRVGRIDPGEICQECGDAADAAFLLSGPKAMIDAFRSQLQEIHSVRSERVLVDAWE